MSDHSSSSPDDHQSLDKKCGCLSYGWFGEVKPNGELVMCSDLYGNPEYSIGNLLNNSIEEIWKSNVRKHTILKNQKSCCVTNFCPKSSRGFMLNKIFYQIERKRRENRMDEVEKWIKRLKETIPRPDHSFFL
jgi:radical SAM protein with 4Fe4S-binding SPASM domain